MFRIEADYVGWLAFFIGVIFIITLAAIVCVQAGIEFGKQKMALVCNVMEQNAGCPFVCASDGCVCSGAKTIQVIG
jgi:hypothetical protein